MSRAPWIGLLAGVLVGLGAGYGLARHAAPSPDEAAARIGEILAEPGPMARIAGLTALLARLEPDALPAVREALAKAPLDRGDPELFPFATWWAEFDPEAAYQWTRDDWRAADATVMAVVFRTWAHSDPEAAWGASQAITFRGHRDVCGDATIAGWDASGRPGLLAFLAGLGEVQRQRAAEIVARRRVVTLGAEQALEWANGLDSEVFRSLMVPRVASGAATADPAAAARWAEPRIAEAERPTGLPRRIATRWAQTDPRAAMAWLSMLPAGYDRDDGVTETFRDWMRRDPIGSRTWLDALQMERWNEPAFALFARSVLSGPDPRGALEMVQKLSDDELRYYHITVIGRAWLEADREAAEAWIEQADLPDGVRERTYMVSQPRKPRVRRDPTNAETAPGA